MKRKISLGILALSLSTGVLVGCNEGNSDIGESKEATAKSESSNDISEEESEDKVIAESESGALGSLPISIRDRITYSEVSGETENNLIKVASKEISRGYFTLNDEEAADYMMLEYGKEMPYIKLSFDITNNTEDQIQLYLSQTYLILGDGEQIPCNDSISGIGDKQDISTIIAPSATVKDVNVVFVPTGEIESLENISLYISNLCDAEGVHMDNSDLKVDISAVE